MQYTNCIRTEKGYCSIQYKQSSATTPDPFNFGTDVTTIGAGAGLACAEYVYIPSTSNDGVTPLNPISVQGFQTTQCGGAFGVDTPTAANLVATPLISKSIMHCSSPILSYYDHHYSYSIPTTLHCWSLYWCYCKGNFNRI